MILPMPWLPLALVLAAGGGAKAEHRHDLEKVAAKAATCAEEATSIEFAPFDRGLSQKHLESD